jgi:colicin import membrane protein
MKSTRTALSLGLRCVVPLAVFVAAGVAWPAPGVDAAASSGAEPASSAAVEQASEETARIVKERAAAEAQFLGRERECRQRFVVTSCLDEAKAERRQSLDQLRARQLIIDEARRHARSEQRKAELTDKAAEDARRSSAHAALAAASAAASDAGPPGRSRPFAPPPPESARAATGGPRDRARSPGTGVGIEPQPRESKALREEREASRRAAFEARNAEAAAHRAEVIERTTKRLAQKAPAAPLPPAASAVSSAAARSASRP